MIGDMKHNLQKMLNSSPLLLSLFAPLETLIYSIGFLVLMDVVTGIWSSVKRGQKITSDRLSRTITKSIVYLLAIIVAHVAGTYVIVDIQIVKVVSGILAAVELLSIYENLTNISGVDFITTIKEKLLPLRVEKENRGEDVGVSQVTVSLPSTLTPDLPKQPCGGNTNGDIKVSLDVK